MAQKKVSHLSLCTFLIAILFFQGFEAGVCPESWIQHLNRCFGVVPQKSSWPEAEVDCQTFGKHGHLASFQTKAEWDVVAKYILANFKDVDDIWVGLEDARRTGQWTWVDRTPLSFFPWNIGEPNNKNGKEYCAHTTIGEGYKKLNDANCQIPKSYLCKSRLL
ncbi:C-type lectin BfL-2-like [Anolis sagrei]|uniref:C-type lectin BfL-2-like n=1 Tax=Anolis sagrei TaxID=38937 RepID=UPI00352110FF